MRLARDGAYMHGDRRVHHTERSKWRLTFRRVAGDALAAPQAHKMSAHYTGGCWRAPSAWLHGGVSSR